MIQTCSRYSLAFAALSILFGSCDVASQDLGRLVDEMERMRRDIDTINVRISGGKFPPVTASKPVGVLMSKHTGTRLMTRMDSLERELRASTGKQETINHQLQLLSERLDKLVGDIDYRFSVLEERQSSLQALGTKAKTYPTTPARVPAAKAVSKEPISGAQPGTLGTIPQSVLDEGKTAQGRSNTVASISEQAQRSIPTAVLPNGTPKEQYTYALNLLRQTNYDQAEIALKQFIEMHSTGSLAGNARYWLGETYYVRADYQTAAQVFFEAFQNSPKGIKAPDMLLKLGMSLARLGKKNEACATYDKVESDFATSSPRIKSAVSRQRQQSRCP